ncbi:MAG: lipopolysaccharide biosynthesis protein [bacterium]
MFNNIKTATKDTFIYSIGNASTKIIGLILIPLYTDKLTVTEYGVLGTVEITIQVLIVTFGFSLNQALSRWYWDKNYQNRQKSIFYTTIVGVSAGMLLMLLLFLPATNRLSLYLLDSQDYSYVFKLLLISASFQIFSRTITVLMRLQRKPIWFSVTNIFKLIVTLGLTIYFIVGLNKSVEGILEAQIIGFIFFIFINTGFILKNIKPKFEFFVLKKMLRFSFPLVISSLGTIILTVTDRYSVRYINGMENMGIYSLGFKFANVLKIFIINSIFSAVEPLKYKLMDSIGSKRFYSKIMTYTAWVVTFLLLGLALYSKEAIRLLAKNPEYWDAYKIIPILCFAQLFGLLRRNATFGLLIAKETKIISFAMIIINILNIVLNIGLIYYFGIIGAATATLVAQIFFFIFIYHFAQKYYFIPYEMKKIWLMITVATGIVLLSFIMIDGLLPLILRILLKFVLIIGFPFILYLFKFYDSVELSRMKGVWNKWKRPEKWYSNIRNIKV